MWKKIILVLIALPIIGLFGFALLFYMTMSVGYLNFMISYWDMREVVALAKDYPMAVDRDIGVAKRNGNLLPQTFARTTIRKDKNQHLHVWFDKGGGHLGIQGYIYSEMMTQSFQETGPLPSEESHRYAHLVGNWWYYDGIYD